MKLQTIALTAGLTTPFLALGVIVLSIWLWGGTRAEQTVRARGAGAGDTGGANAIGEWLAGNDAEQIEARAQALRRGDAVRAHAWPGGVRAVVSRDDLSRLGLDPVRTVLVVYPGQGCGGVTLTRRFSELDSTRLEIRLTEAEMSPALGDEACPRGGLYLSDAEQIPEDDTVADLAELTLGLASPGPDHGEGDPLLVSAQVVPPRPR